jgi:ATP-binding cassette subfamily B protein
MKFILKIKYYIYPYWKESILALILLTAVVFMDLAIPRLIQRLIDDGINGGSSTVVIHTSLIMLVLSVLSAIFAIGNNYFSVKAGEGVARDLREDLFIKIQSFSFGNLDRLRTGQLIVRLTSDVMMLQRVSRMILRIGTRAPLLMVGSLFLMYQTSTKMAITLLPLFIVTGVMIVVFVVKLSPMFLIVQQKLDAVNTVLQENISGVRVIKAFVRADYENQRFEVANEDFTEKNIKVMQLMAVLFPMLTLMINFGIVIVYWRGGLQAMVGDLSTGEIVAFSNYLLSAMFPLMIMAMLSNVLAAGNASAERIDEVLSDPPEVQDQPEAVELSADIRGRVVFENVSFHYNGASDEPVLCGVNLTAEPGETVAILGATGSGKTTLINLIPRFYDVTGGCVTIDGIDVRNISQDSLLAQVGVALQEAILFSGSVRDNIRFGHPEASDEEVTSAAKAAQAHEFIMDLPQGYDTDIAQRGVNLSGGQKQRIAIARALLLKPKILILDDSTSAVDVETETEIQAALEKLMVDRTSFVVAQRISTVLNADKIVVIDKGQIAAEGTHNELIESSKIYQEIYDSQLGNGFAPAMAD